MKTILIISLLFLAACSSPKKKKTYVASQPIEAIDNAFFNETLNQALKETLELEEKRKSKVARDLARERAELDCEIFETEFTDYELTYDKQDARIKK